MRNFGILMLIFATGVLLIGLYMFKGHKIDLITWRAQYKHLSKNEWKNIGKWTIIVSIFIYIIALISIIMD